MKWVNVILFYLFVVLFISTTLWGQGNTDKSGTTAAQFLKIGAGARMMGLAGASAAQVDDVYSLYWNPAGISKVNQVALGAAHTRWFADITHNFLGIVLPINENHAIGFQATFLSMDPIQITTINEPRGTGEFFEASDIAIGASYSTRPVDFLSLGVTAKFIQQSIYNESASAYALDFGSVLDIPWRGVKLGMQFSNFGSKMQLDGRDLVREFDLNPGNTLNTGVETRLRTLDWDLPVNFRVGLAMDLVGKNADGLLQNENSRLTLMVDGNHPADAAEYMNMGLEYGLNEVLMLRGGYRINRDVEKMFYGVGLNIPLSGASSFVFDYAIASFDELDYVHVFSANISL